MQIPDRRRYRRISCGTATGTIESGGRQAPCEVLDESIGGFRIQGINPMTLRRNEPFTIEHRGERIDVVCANAFRRPNAGFTIGVKRIDTMETNRATTSASVDDVLRNLLGPSLGDKEEFTEPTPEPVLPTIIGSLINPYVYFGRNAGVLCRVINVKDQSNLCIEILGQKRFTLAPDNVYPMTREERRIELEEEESVAWLAELYTACSSASVAPSIESILDFEFEHPSS